MTEEFSYRQEIYRKLIHLSSLWIPIAIYMFEKKTSLLIFFSGIILVYAYERIRKQDHALARLLNKTLGAALRPDEKEATFKPSGAVYVLIAAFLSTLIFPETIAITALSMMLIGDAAAALIGRKYGKHKLLGKSVEGTVAFSVTAFINALIIAAFIPVESGYLTAATIAAFVAAFVELVSKKIGLDDNLTISLAIGFVMMLIM